MATPAQPNDVTNLNDAEHSVGATGATTSAAASTACAVFNKPALSNFLNLLLLGLAIMLFSYFVHLDLSLL